LLCEVIDWILAVFYPVYFHSSSLLVRLLPFIIGFIFCTAVVTGLIIIDANTEAMPCVSSRTDTAVFFTYDISLALATICMVAFVGLLARKLNSSLYKPVLFHFVSTLILIEIPLLVLIVLKDVGNSKSVVTAADVTSLLVVAHAIFHSGFFIYNHEDYRVSKQTVL
uniref:MARVEL domain-containing protein n=1 Tax=Angiostrongylus costaricensis TaxID=334426 RepID=A0A0R3PLS2_ANGCS